MTNKTVVRDVKISSRLMVTAVSAQDRLIVSSETRRRGDTAEAAFAEYVGEFVTQPNVADVDLQNDCNALVTLDDGNQIFIAVMLSDTQCPTCGSAQNVNQTFCPDCAKRVKVTQSNGVSALDALKAKMAAQKAAAEIQTSPAAKKSAK